MIHRQRLVSITLILFHHKSKWKIWHFFKIKFWRNMKTKFMTKFLLIKRKKIVRKFMAWLDLNLNKFLSEAKKYTTETISRDHALKRDMDLFLPLLFGFFCCIKMMKCIQCSMDEFPKTKKRGYIIVSNKQTKNCLIQFIKRCNF